MRRIKWSVFVLAAGAWVAAAEAGPTKLWEVGGLETPESVLPVPDAGIAYVSSSAGEMTVKDGNGFISKVSLDGKMLEPKWVTGLDAPKGLALAGGRLYTADIDRLVEIDTASGKVIARHEAKDAKFLNDVAADGQGRIYVSDTGTNTIWRLADGQLEPWLKNDALKSPNGLLVQGDKLIVAAWGVTGEGGATLVAGNLIEVSLTDKSVRDLGDGKPIGNFDGLEPLGPSSYLVTDWMAGTLLKIDASGQAEVLLKLNQGSADLAYLPDTRTALIPMMKDNKLVAYRID